MSLCAHLCCCQTSTTSLSNRSCTLGRAFALLTAHCTVNGAPLYRLHGGTIRRLRPDTTFKDIAGLEEVKGEVMEVIEFLRNPKKFDRLGARSPLGVLLAGPPGTGAGLPKRLVMICNESPGLQGRASHFKCSLGGVGERGRLQTCSPDGFCNTPLWDRPNGLPDPGLRGLHPVPVDGCQAAAWQPGCWTSCQQHHACACRGHHLASTRNQACQLT